MSSDSTSRLDRGKFPFQDFRKIQELRDSIVHLSDGKADAFDAIGEKEATRAVDVAIEVIREISRCIASNPTQAAFHPG